MLYISIEEEMAEMTSPVIPAKKLTGYERIKDASRKFYVAKIHTDPDFYAKEKERIKLYKYNRYQNDPEYAEKDRQAAKARYHARKLKLQEEAKLANTTQSSESE
jgi:hypothetical protein